MKDGNGIVVMCNGDYNEKSSITLDTGQKTSQSENNTVNNPDEHLKPGMRLVDSKHSVNYKDKVVLITKVVVNAVTLSSPVTLSDHEE